MNEQRAVLECHLAVLEEIVDEREEVSLGLFEALDDEQPAVQRRLDDGLVDIQHRARRQLAPLLEVGLGGVARDRHHLGLALDEGRFEVLATYSFVWRMRQQPPAEHGTADISTIHVLELTAGEAARVRLEPKEYSAAKWFSADEARERTRACGGACTSDKHTSVRRCVSTHNHAQQHTTSRTNTRVCAGVRVWERARASANT